MRARRESASRFYRSFFSEILKGRCSEIHFEDTLVGNCFDVIIKKIILKFLNR